VTTTPDTLLAKGIKDVVTDGFERHRRQAGFCLLLVAIDGFAQGVTGTLAGAVKDEQVPSSQGDGHSSASQGTVAPAVTAATGDFVIPNITADTCGSSVTFIRLNRTDVRVSPRARADRHADDLGRRRRKPSTSRASLADQATTVLNTTDNVTSLPLASRSYDSLGLAPGIQTSTGLTFASRIGGGGDSNFISTAPPPWTSTGRPPESASRPCRSAVATST
jgi:hypothetical protein